RPSAAEPPDRRPHVVIVGGGFGGLLTARGLRRAPVRVTLVDRRNHHLFQPLLYQVATGGLSPANIAAPLRALVHRQANTRVLLAEVRGLELEARRVLLASAPGEGDAPINHDGTHGADQEVMELGFDYLVVAAGAGHSYFGHPEWQDRAPGLKSLEDATLIRRRVLLAFERAERESDPERISQLLTFVVVGAGPTGVELAGALAEMAHNTLVGQFRKIDTHRARVLLVEGAERVLPPFSERLAKSAHRSLRDLGVEVRTRTLVRSIDEHTVTLASTGEGEEERISAATVLWAAGVRASPLAESLAEQSGAEMDRIGRVVVEADCSLHGRPEVFAIGDLANYRHGLEQPLPGLAPIAMQQGRYVARRLARRTRGKPEGDAPFHYVDKGNMAVIGRRRAVADIRGFEITGGLAWLMWLFVHLMYLAEFQNRILVLVQWGWNYVTRNRSARLITNVPDPGIHRTTPPSAEGG
ncbi:MAG: NAD(P)/FAD-dependent oxidoreductase, partial [Holophagales bacterium]|nr:NAD(P)/FAD-dependent oxidoreductase [Holophagales bacterium]